MINSSLAIRYAAAWYSFAREKAVLDESKSDAELILAVYREKSDLKFLLESPTLNPGQKIEALKVAFKGKVHHITVDFMTLLVKNKRERHLAGICQEFLRRYRVDQGIKKVVLTTALPLDREAVEQFRNRLSSDFGGQIELQQQVDPDIIGGFVLNVDDHKQLDVSVQTRLKKIKQRLLE